MKYYGLIGYPLSHSFSKKYFSEKFDSANIADAQYDLFPLKTIDEFKDLLVANRQLCGLNVTIPYKVDVISYLDWIAPDAETAGAVNCIKVVAMPDSVSGRYRLEGFNTDLYGFEMSLIPLMKVQHQSALILGDGGAARAVKYVMNKLGIKYRCVTRKPIAGNLLFTDLTAEEISNNHLIINTTPLGTAPNVDECPPIPYEAITGDHLLYDLIYNPEETLFLKRGREHGAVTKNGYEMLILQAEKSWEIWNSETKQF